MPVCGVACSTGGPQVSKGVGLQPGKSRAPTPPHRICFLFCDGPRGTCTSHQANTHNLLVWGGAPR